VEADPFYEPGDLAKIKAQPAAGYCFVHWTQNGAVVSTDSIYYFNVTANRTLVGHFAPGNMIRASAYPGLGGTVTGGGVYLNGAAVTLTATGKPGYVFLNWTEGAAVVSTSPTLSFNASASRTLVANFVAGSPVPPRLNLNRSGSDVVITWPATSNYGLQVNTSLDPAGWTEVTTGIVVVGDTKQYTASAVAGNGFFRLIQH
jgi:hypothetical protein